MKPLQIEASSASGQPVTNAKPTFTSSDPGVVSVSSDGVLKGIQRGSAKIDATIGQVTASLTVKVTARLAIEYAMDLGALALWGAKVVAVGDTVRFVALYTDVDGKFLDDRPSVAWASDNPDGATVDSLGVMIARRHDARVRISASNAEGTATTGVWVDIPRTGSATIRFAHAADGLGPMTFLPTKGSKAALRFGEWIDMQVPPGIFQVNATGFPTGENNWRSSNTISIRSGEVVAFYVLGAVDRAGLVPVWTMRQAIPPDSARFALLQAMVDPLLIVYVAGHDESTKNSPDECYFDPGDVSEYYWRSPGLFDLVLQRKYAGAEQVRLGVTVEGGRGYTVVFTGTPSTRVGRLVFPDP